MSRRSRICSLSLLLAACTGAGSDGTTEEPSTTATGDATTSTGSDPSEGTGAPTTGDPSAATTDAPGTTGDPPGTTGDPPGTTGDPPDTTGGEEVELPPPDGEFDYQLGGAYDPPASVQIVARDRNDPPAPGLYNICYVNGFQAQPDEESFWLDEHPDLVLRDGMGDPVIDLDWDEMLLDTGTPDKRAALAVIVGGWIAGCKAAGYQAVEIDNLDSYSRSQDLLTQDDAVAYMALLSAVAHAEGLAIAQKNSTEILDRAGEMGTDFAVAEECSTYQECGDYVGTYGDAVLMIEYVADDFAQGCADWPQMSIVLRDVNLTTPGDADYVRDAC